MENTVAKKLELLSRLQKIDSQLDNIKKIRGALPEEVQDLEDEIAGFTARLEKFEGQQNDFEVKISDFKNGIKNSEALLKKYEEQQKNVRNNREYEAITKEMELQTLEIQINEKKIKDAYAKIELKKEDISGTKERIDERGKDLKNKQEELQVIVAESEEEETKLMKERDKAMNSLEERLQISYQKIRDNARNGLAVVNVDRAACGGCFNIVPPQRQADIREQKRLIVCEHCGRVLAGVDDEIQKEVPKRTRRRKVADAKK